MKVINVNSLSAFRLLNGNSAFHLIDVRTEREWQHGIPMVDNLRLLSLRLYPDMSINKIFYEYILTFKGILKKDEGLFFLCKSGFRSFEAATIATEYGIDNCYNIIDGFEGSTWGVGWRENNLPYKPFDSFDLPKINDMKSIVNYVC